MPTSKEPVGSYVVAYCDGSCGAEDRAGGWGYIVHDALDVHERWGYVLETTNNQMELVAAISALECMMYLGMKRRPILVCTDSQYVTNGSQSEIRWRRNDKVKNLDLWREVWDLMKRFDHCSFAWVRGHAGHFYNEQADRLADRGRQHALTLLRRR